MQISFTLQQAQPPKDNISVKKGKLKNDKDIIILPTEKGRVTVILNKEDSILQKRILYTIRNMMST